MDKKIKEYAKRLEQGKKILERSFRKRRPKLHI